MILVLKKKKQIENTDRENEKKGRNDEQTKIIRIDFADNNDSEREKKRVKFVKKKTSNTPENKKKTNSSGIFRGFYSTPKHRHTIHIP